MSERGRYEPRGMMLMTAEEQPTLESTLARVCIIEVAEGSLNLDKLTAIQKNAALLPFAMRSYITWLRENMTELKENFPIRFRELREYAATKNEHRKLPEQAAFLGFALETTTSFFYSKGTLSRDAAAALVSEGWEVFRQLAEKQQQRIHDDDPVMLFEDVLSTLLIQHNVKLDPLPAHDGERIGAGDSIGYFDATFLYLLPSASWHAVQKFCITENTHFPYSKNTFWKMLKNREIIMPAPSGQSSVLIKIGSKPVRVLKIIDGGMYGKLVTSVTN
jgi:hypothetical protein